MFEKVPSSPRFPALELDVLKFWKERDVYGQSLKLRADAPSFVFYEGPPTANGMPHPGHCLTRAIKDLFPRYRTMRGYRCERKAGWDTHGLPVEVEVSKGLGIHTKEEIEAYGQEKFIQLCQASVWKYMQHWEQLTERLGFWVNLSDAYVTYHQSYVESVWWALKNFHDRGLLYQDHKIVWWWAQGGTALSAGEVGQGYRKVADPSVYVRFPLLDDAGNDSGESLLVWTTTPWTLPSNMFAAVKGDLEYSVVKDPESPDLLVMASALVETVAGKVQRKLEVVRTLSGSELVGRRYRPPFGDYYEKHGAKTGTRADGSAAPLYWYVADASFVETTSGSGVVHIAPAFGEVDFDLLKTEREKFTEDARPELLCAVGPDGKFTDEAPAYSGRWVKEADKDISRQLRQEGKVYHHEQYLHDYPFCWRAEEDPLIQYPRKSWFIRTTKFKESMLANNAEINWLPEHIKDGRFGNYLESNVDWSLSRERFWGTPLPIWVCEKTGKREAIASYDELLAKPGASGQEVWLAAKKANPELVDDLKVHKPYIDAVTYDSPFAAGAKMKRVTEVIDCWFDSGAMPFAQWGWPHQNADKFRSQFPADFISEALDQTRGWFYSLLSISTLLFSEQARQEQGAAALLPKNVAPPEAAFPHPFRNCIVLGLMLGEDGTKLSKSKKNYRSPDELFDRYGADALRWYFYSGQAPWSEIRYNEQSIKDSLPEFLLRLWNVYSFFVNYANAEGFDPATLVQGKVGDLPASQLRSAQGARPVAQRRELDRYILSELHRTVAVVSTEMDAYNNFGAAKALNEFVDVLSNWYLRLSRGFFSSGRSESAHREATLDAYWTLYECLTTVTKLVAPFTPFFAETLWKNLVRTPFGDRALESVHLADFPVVDETAIDALLSSQMKLGREIVSLGRAARAEAKLKVRQPLAKVEVILADPTHQNWLREHREFAADELNVHEVEMATDADQYISYVVLPDLKKLGKRLGKLLPLVKAALGKADGAKLMHDLQKTGETTLTVDGQNVALTRDDLIVRLEAKPGWAAAQGEQAVVVLSTEITPKLAREGLAREIVHTIQSARKDIGCDFADKIDVALVGGGPDVQAVVGEFADYIGSETQALSLVQEPLSGVSPVEIEVGGAKASLYVAVSAAAAGRPQA